MKFGKARTFELTVDIVPDSYAPDPDPMENAHGVRSVTLQTPREALLDLHIGDIVSFVVVALTREERA